MLLLHTPKHALEFLEGHPAILELLPIGLILILQLPVHCPELIEHRLQLPNLSDHLPLPEHIVFLEPLKPDLVLGLLLLEYPLKSDSLLLHLLAQVGSLVPRDLLQLFGALLVDAYLFGRCL